jgi:hypothetical protein
MAALVPAISGPGVAAKFANSLPKEVLRRLAAVVRMMVMPEEVCLIKKCAYLAVEFRSGSGRISSQLQ